MQAQKSFCADYCLRLLASALFLCAAPYLAGCALNPLTPVTTPLPDLKRDSVDGMLVPAQQQKAIDDLARKKAEEQAQALKQIAKSR